MIHARKRFGQHFLEAAWVQKLVAASGVGPEDSVLEIGPGRGAITRPLAARARRLLAVEVDRVIDVERGQHEARTFEFALAAAAPNAPRRRVVGYLHDGMVWSRLQGVHPAQ